jgi:hypothetical protein
MSNRMFIQGCFRLASFSFWFTQLKRTPGDNLYFDRLR